MPSLEVEVLTEGQSSVTTLASGQYDIEVNLGTVVTTGTVTEVEVAEVQLPGSIGFENTVKNAGGAPALMVLEAAAPVPPGTPAGTVILRKE